MGNTAFFPAGFFKRNAKATLVFLCFFTAVSGIFSFASRTTSLNNSSSDLPKSTLILQSSSPPEKKKESINQPEVLVPKQNQAPPSSSLDVSWKAPSFTPRHPLNFLHIPKTGGSSVESVAIKHNLTWGYFLFETKGFQRNQIWWHTPIQYLPSNPYEGSDLFAVVRNPYERVVSEFYYKCQYLARNHPCKKATVNSSDGEAVLNQDIQSVLRVVNQAEPNSKDYYVNWKHWIPQYDYFYNANGTRMIEHLLHNENLAQEFDSLMDAYGLNMTLPGKHSRPRSDTFKGSALGASALSLDTMKVIESVYAQDFEIGGYSMRSPQF